MSQTKVQLIAPIGVVTASTLETTGVLTATTFVGDIAGTVTGITSTTDNLDVGIVTATAFVGDFTGTASSIVTGSNVTAGIITGTKFIGNATGTVSGLADDTNINVGIITSTSFVGDLTGNAAGLSTTNANLSLGIVTATSFAGNITGNAAGISVTTTNANLGIITASAFHGDGGNLNGVSGGPVGQQAVTANSGTTTIDLSSGNLIYMTQSSDTTVSFANTEGSTDVVYFVRAKDATSTARTITWPSTISWNGGSDPSLLNANSEDEAQIFKLTTRDNGATWYGSEIYNNDGGKTLWGMGANYFGALGINGAHPALYSSPVQISGLWHYTANGTNWTISTKTDGTIWSWGINTHGQLGLNSQTQYSSPVQVGSDTTWNTATCGSNMSYATKTDGTLWSWGYNNRGELGVNDTNRRSSPTQIPGTTWGSGDKLSSGHDFVLSIKTDGTLWSWGSNSYGCLGHNNAHPTGTASSPVQVPGTNWAMVRGNQTSAAATKTDGTLWAWGMNNGGGAGSLGQNDQVGYSSPVQIPGTTWSKVIGVGPFAYTALKTDGTLWAWGVNTDGKLGQNNTTAYSSPVQIPGTTWSNGVGSAYAAFWVKTDGTGWRWGNNQNGQLGQNSTTTYSSPIQIPGIWNVDKVQGRQNANMSFGMKA